MQVVTLKRLEEGTEGPGEKPERGWGGGTSREELEQRKRLDRERGEQWIDAREIIQGHCSLCTTAPRLQAPPLLPACPNVPFSVESLLLSNRSTVYKLGFLHLAFFSDSRNCLNVYPAAVWWFVLTFLILIKTLNHRLSI